MLSKYGGALDPKPVGTWDKVKSVGGVVLGAAALKFAPGLAAKGWNGIKNTVTEGAKGFGAAVMGGPSMSALRDQFNSVAQKGLSRIGEYSTGLTSQNKMAIGVGRPVGFKAMTTSPTKVPGAAPPPPSAPARVSGFGAMKKAHMEEYERLSSIHLYNKLSGIAGNQI